MEGVIFEGHDKTLYLTQAFASHGAVLSEEVDRIGQSGPNTGGRKYIVVIRVRGKGCLSNGFKIFKNSPRQFCVSETEMKTLSPSAYVLSF